MTPRAAMELAAFAALLIPLLGMGHPRILGAARSLAASRTGAAALSLALVAPAAVALPWSRPGEAAARAAGLALYALLPLAALLAARSRSREVSVWDWAAVACFWIPVQAAGMEGWWSRTGGWLEPPWMKLTAACLVLAGFAAIRRLDGVGARWRLAGTDAVTAAGATVLFLAVAVPFALLSGVAAWNPDPAGVARLPAIIAGALLFTALPEEILFRGVLFNLLQRRLRGRRGPWPALGISSLAFAAAHAGWAGGDLRTLALVALAGLAYGWCALRSGSLVPAVAAHTAVNTIHQLLFATVTSSP